MEKPQTFAIKAENKKLLEAIWEDLMKMGYKSVVDYSKVLNGFIFNYWNETYIDNKEKFSQLIIGELTRFDVNKTFTLPDQYSEALEFAKAQITSDWWTKDQFKVGEWLYKEASDCFLLFRFNSKTDFGDFFAKESYFIDMKNPHFIREIREDNLITNNNITRATTEQIERILSKVAVWKGYKDGVKINIPYGKNDKYTGPIEGNLFEYDADDVLYNLTSKYIIPIYKAGQWVEIIKDSPPDIKINGYTVNFYDTHISWGYNFTVEKDLILKLNDLLSVGYRPAIESVMIGKGTFTALQIKQIAEYYLNKEK